jgi:hypothetical protein
MRVSLNFESGHVSNETTILLEKQNENASAPASRQHYSFKLFLVSGG